MTPPSVLKRAKERLQRLLPGSGGENEGADPSMPPEANSPETNSPAEGVPTFRGTSHTCPELASEVGQIPEQYILDLLAERGAITQQRLIELSGLSASAITRLLQAMEEKQEIERIRYGREKIVTDPDASITDIGLREREWGLLLAAVLLRYYVWIGGRIPGVVTGVAQPLARATAWVVRLGSRHLGQTLALLSRLLPRLP
jgi:hypothetical protein